MEPEAAKQPEKAEDFADSRKRQIEEFDRRLAIYGSLEVLDEEWERSLKQVKKAFSGPDRGAKYVQWRERFLDFIRHSEFEYEHLLVYYLFRYFLKTVVDRDVLPKLQLAAVGVLAVRELELAAWMAGHLDGEARVNVIHRFSRQVEHSGENMETLRQWFRADPAFSTAALEAAHTVKGVCGNLAVSELFGLLDRQVQLLRAHDMAGAAAVMPEITRTYQAAVQAVEKAFS